MKKVPERTCVITKEKLPKQELIRVVRTPEGKVVVDETGKQNGRGAYLKKDIEVFNKAKKTKILDRILEVEVNEEVYSDLEKLV